MAGSTERAGASGHTQTCRIAGPSDAQTSEPQEPDEPLPKARLAKSADPDVWAGSVPFARTLPSGHPRLVRDEPHVGLGFNPFDLKALSSTQLSALEREALGEYLDPGFVRAPAAEKKRILDAISCFLPGARPVLEAFHLPLSFSSDSGGQPITLSTEAEFFLETQLQILDGYAPDPSGELDARAFPDELLDAIEESRQARIGRFGEAWVSMSRGEKKNALRWKDLSPDARFAYLTYYRQVVDPKVNLYRIADPRASPVPRLTPASLKDKVLWDGDKTPLGIAEISTQGYSESLDQLFADVGFLVGMGPNPPGFHVHEVVEMSSPEDIARVGPAFTGLVALLDLQLFAFGALSGAPAFNHLHLEVWQATHVNEVAESFRRGVIDPDVLIIHKFHGVAIRTGLYGGDGSRVGMEIRAVPMQLPSMLLGLVRGVASILHSGSFLKLEAPPWPWWNAGDMSLPNRAYEEARSDPKFSEIAKGAEIDFSAILEIAAEPHTARDTFRYASPFWNFEALPGVTPEISGKIGTARDGFVRALLEISENLTEAIEAGREIDGEFVKRSVDRAARIFFMTARIDQLIGTTLARLEQGIEGEPAVQGMAGATAS